MVFRGNRDMNRQIKSAIAMVFTLILNKYFNICTLYPTNIYISSALTFICTNTIGLDWIGHMNNKLNVI